MSFENDDDDDWMMKRVKKSVRPSSGLGDGGLCGAPWAADFSGQSQAPREGSLLAQHADASAEFPVTQGFQQPRGGSPGVSGGIRENGP